MEKDESSRLTDKRRIFFLSYVRQSLVFFRSVADSRGEAGAAASPTDWMHLETTNKWKFCTKMHDFCTKFLKFWGGGQTPSPPFHLPHSKLLDPPLFSVTVFLTLCDRVINLSHSITQSVNRSQHICMLLLASLIQTLKPMRPLFHRCDKRQKN